MEISALSEWNPWWENKEIGEDFKGKPRSVYKDLIDSTEIKEVTIITGIRRAGKSTLMYQMIHNLLKQGIEPLQILFVNLEDKKFIKNSIDEIYLCYRENLNLNKKAYIFLDEIHKKEGWESWIRKKYDLKTKDKFVISGSSSYLLKKEYSSLLTGRNLTFEVLPLSFNEFLFFKGISFEIENIKKGIVSEKTAILLAKHAQEFLTIGGFPELFFTPQQFQQKLLQQYFDDIIYKDIIDRYNLNAQKTKDLALNFMTNITGLFSLRSIRSSLQLSYDTVKDYLSYYREAFLFFVVDHFSYSFKEQKTLPSKIYCIDNGLRNAVAFTFSMDSGKLAENAVFIELKRQNKDVYYWKDKGEVDFIVKNKDNSLTAINVSFSDEISERETKSLNEFKSKFSYTKELIIITKNLEKKEESIRFIPLWKWLLT